MKMDEIQKQMLREPCSITAHREFHAKLEDDHSNNYDIASSTSSFEDSSVSNGSISSLELADDASSSSSNSSSQSDGPLDDFTQLFAQLPIKRGLSMFYQGKSQSFTSLSRVKNIEDLVKKETPYSRRLNGCKSYAGGLDTHKSYTLPKATTFKKASRGSLSSSFQVRRSSTLSMGSSRPPSIHVYDNNS